MLTLAAALLLSPVSTPVELASTPAALHGTLLTPEGQTRAAAVILPGSGPTDRDGNSAQFGIKAASYRLLAEGLAERGVATIRIDKRGIGESAAAGPAETDLRFNTYADDARAWAAEAAAKTGHPCAWLIGHSEGALVALKAVASHDDNICGLVLLSGAGRPAGVVLREQLAALPEPLKTRAYDVLSEVEAGRTVADPPAELTALFRPSVQPYLISWLTLAPADLAAAYDGPIFVGQGTTDLQVSVADAQAIKAAQPRADLVVWDGVNHVLKTAPTDRAANVATYMDPALPLAPGVVEAVADFVLKRR
ncbi:alpha/beta hydrolase [Brevundimonas sp. P7753]|uniref:alpha/beta hydrolase n=1 Tax=Brevundimonas sp. P7753 TaxID=2726982 RepID=UPI0015BDBF3E|nr:alpha/beta fold hydrolase [Brevundimonas sp. P7753]NWE52607.1 alpha/beta fold hydrolase [Brevundimonas sp. P7753]